MEKSLFFYLKGRQKQGYSQRASITLNRLHKKMTEETYSLGSSVQRLLYLESTGLIGLRVKIVDKGKGHPLYELMVHLTGEGKNRTFSNMSKSALKKLRKKRLMLAGNSDNSAVDKLETKGSKNKSKRKKGGIKYF